MTMPAITVHSGPAGLTVAPQVQNAPPSNQQEAPYLTLGRCGAATTAKAKPMCLPAIQP
jgi:hypothetical protein